jgi:hypothetical protein
MTPQTVSKNESTQVLQQTVIGSRRLSNYVFASISTIGGVGFLLASLSGYLHTNLLPLASFDQVVFMPQQWIAMGFYGVTGTLLALYLWLIILWDVGGGYNEFNRETREFKLFRWGFPGKNRRVDIRHSLDDVLSVRVDIKEGINPKRALYLRVKGKGEYPLTRVGQPLPLADLENQGAELARFLGIPLEGL